MDFAISVKMRGVASGGRIEKPVTAAVRPLASIERGIPVGVQVTIDAGAGMRPR